MLIKYRFALLTLVIVAALYGLLASVPLMPEAMPSGHAQTVTELPPFPTSTPSPAASLAPFPTTTPTVPPTVTRPASSSSGGGRDARVVEMTCHAEPRWGYLVNVRRGPGENWGVLRQLVHDDESPEMRVFGRDSAGEWYQVVLPPPYETTVGWAWIGGMNLYGVCADLPVTEETPEITIEDVPPLPERIPLPDFAAEVELGEHDRAFLLNPGMLYVRRTVPGERQADRLQAHILVMDLEAQGVEVGVTVGAEPDRRAVPVSQMADEAGAFAAITGDFYGGNYMPQNMTIVDGEIISAPKFRATFAITEDKEPYIGYFTTGWTWPAYVVAANGEVIPLQLMNLPCQEVWLCLYTHHIDNRLPVRANAYDGVRVLVDETSTVVEIVNNEYIEIPDGYRVLRGGGVTGDWLRANIEVGDQIEIVLPTEPDWRNFQHAIGGGPRILLDGEFWQDCDPAQAQPVCEEFDERFRNTHYFDMAIPRAAIGYNEAGDVLIAIMVEGYEVADSDGATQRELAEIFLEMGAHQAMEFDGGGSATMWIYPGGAVNDFGYEGERPISNALLFFWEQ